MDTENLVDILFKSILDEMGITDLKLKNTSTSLKGFDGGKLTPLGVFKLPVTINSTSFQKTMILDFVVVDEYNSYQIILGRPFLRISKAVISNYYMALKGGAIHTLKISLNSHIFINIFITKIPII